MTGQGDGKYKKTRLNLLNGCRVFSKRKADNRIFDLRVIGSTSVRLAL